MRSRKSPSKAVGVLAAIVASGVGCDAPPVAAELAEATVFWESEGGEPPGVGARYELRRANGKDELAVAHTRLRRGERAPGQSHLQTEEQIYPLAAGELAMVWQIVERDQLTSFAPKEAGGGEVADFGHRKLLLRWRDGQEVQERTHSWTQPIANRVEVEGLLLALRVLERRHLRVPDGPDLGHVVPGQVYTFSREEDGEQTERTRRVLEVHAASVLYEESSAGAAPERRLWIYERPAEDLEPFVSPGEQVTISGHTFDTVDLVLDMGRKTHTRFLLRAGKPTFPEQALRLVVANGQPVFKLELVAIEPAAPDTAEGGGDPDPG